MIERLRSALREAIKSCPLSRYEIAGKMSHLVGHTITKEVIDSWTRESQEIPPAPLYESGENMGSQAGACSYSTGKRIMRHVPAEYLPAFCKVTRSYEPLRLLSEVAGLFVFQGPEAMRVDIQHTDEAIKKLQSEKRRMLMFVREMEKER